MASVARGGRGGGVQFTWRGATVLRAWEAQVEAGMRAEADEVLGDLRSSIHVWTGDMRRQAFARVEARGGGKRTLVAGSASEHAVYEELGTSRREAHPVIRQVVDRHIPHVTQKIRNARSGV